MFHYKVKNMEPFKDGNVLGSRFVAPGEVLIVDGVTKQKMEQSGAVLEVLETLVPNPLKHIAETPALKEVGESKVLDLELPIEEKTPKKKKGGRPRKSQ